MHSRNIQIQIKQVNNTTFLTLTDKYHRNFPDSEQKVSEAVLSNFKTVRC